VDGRDKPGHDGIVCLHIADSLSRAAGWFLRRGVANVADVSREDW